MPNMLHVHAAIGRLVAQGKDASQVYHNVRESIDLDAVGFSRSAVQKEATSAGEAYSSLTMAIEKRKWELDLDERELRADLIDAFNSVDLSAAGRVRELHKGVQGVLSSVGYPSIVDACDLLDELSVDSAPFRTRLDALGFPELEKDPDETSPTLERMPTEAT